MTIKEAFTKGLRKVRLPVWNPHAYVELVDSDGFLAPWGKLHDVGCDGKELLLLGDTDPSWEPWTGDIQFIPLAADEVSS